jgi:hypothetical protein
MNKNKENNKEEKKYNVSESPDEPIEKKYQSEEEREKLRSKDLEQGSETITSEANFKDDEATDEEIKESYNRKEQQKED